MDASQSKTTAALFQVYLRLRPSPILSPVDRFLSVERSIDEDEAPTHIILNPPNDNRRRAVEKFGFTKIFEEQSSQLDIFQDAGIIPLIRGVIGPNGGDGRDGLLATLGVTGSGKTHTILGSRTQRGLTQLSLDVLFRSLSEEILDPNSVAFLHAAIAASDPSEAQVLTAQSFLETLYGDPLRQSQISSRAPTPMNVRQSEIPLHPSSLGLYPSLLSLNAGSPKRAARESALQQSDLSSRSPVTAVPSYLFSTISKSRKTHAKVVQSKGDSMPPPTPRRAAQRPLSQPTLPDVSFLTVPVDQSAEYAVVVSMYEVYNDRIFDLLTPPSKNTSAKDYRRRPLLFKPTEQSPDRKVVAGLRKIICSNAKEALMILDAGLQERRVAQTGSNNVSSRSHGFFCVEVKKRRKGRSDRYWSGSTLTIVDLAGSERARDAKTQGATLAEAGKINESLMYLGQCLQMQSDIGSGSTKPNLVPFRQCKLTELLFSNSFPSSASHSQSHTSRNPQKGVMIVIADPVGDFNATSQILRYSALAREITVPRIPSVSSTILGKNGGYGRHSPTSSDSGNSETRETMEIAALEISRLNQEIDGLRVELDREQQRRLELEAHLLSSEERVMEIESEVREECYQEMEVIMKREMGKWKATWAEEMARNDEHIDRKIDILSSYDDSS